jgi:hypothetical protein
MGLRPIPGKIGEVTALSCTSAGRERRSEAGTRRWLAKVRRETIAGADLGTKLIEDRAPFDAHGRDRRRSEFLGRSGRAAGEGQNESSQPNNDQADSFRFQCVAPRRHHAGSVV